MRHLWTSVTDTCLWETNDSRSKRPRHAVQDPSSSSQTRAVSTTTETAEQCQCCGRHQSVDEGGQNFDDCLVCGEALCAVCSVGEPIRCCRCARGTAWDGLGNLQITISDALLALVAVHQAVLYLTPMRTQRGRLFADDVLPARGRAAHLHMAHPLTKRRKRKQG